MLIHFFIFILLLILFICDICDCSNINQYQIIIHALHSSKDIYFNYSIDLYNELNDWYIYCDDFCIKYHLYYSSKSCGIYLYNAVIKNLYNNTNEITNDIIIEYVNYNWLKNSLNWRTDIHINEFNQYHNIFINDIYNYLYLNYKSNAFNNSNIKLNKYINILENNDIISIMDMPVENHFINFSSLLQEFHNITLNNINILSEHQSNIKCNLSYGSFQFNDIIENSNNNNIYLTISTKKHSLDYNKYEFEDTIKNPTFYTYPEMNQINRYF
jgi:hypothetical protein